MSLNEAVHHLASRRGHHAWDYVHMAAWYAATPSNPRRARKKRGLPTGSEHKSFCSTCLMSESEGKDENANQQGSPADLQLACAGLKHAGYPVFGTCTGKQGRS